MEQWNHLYIKGQAILELAIFGSILIMLLGILINYGLRYGFQQQVMQQAFRQALATAAVSMDPHTPVSTSHIVVRDKHIPNPADTFAVGSVMPFSSGASIVRSYKLDETPDYEDELPQVIIDVQGEKIPYKTAGFSYSFNVSEESIDKYVEIYGNSIQGLTNQGSTKEGWVKLKKLTKDDKACIKYDAKNADKCKEYSINKIRFIDSCAGQIMNYDAAVRQCRLIVDEEVCTETCEEGGGKKCADTCSKPMNAPWYCGTRPGINPATDYEEINDKTHQYNFKVLNQIFAFTPDKSKGMGLQDGYTQVATTNNKLEKRESAAGIASRDTFDWKVETERKIISRDMRNENAQTNETNVVGTVEPKSRTQEWQTDW